MKKTIHFLVVLTTIALVTFSCKDDITNEPFVNGSATIQGTAFVNTDLTNDTVGILLENVPAGTRIYGILSSEDLVQFPDASVDYGDIIVDTVVGAGGAFTMVVPANNKNVTVAFFADDFVENQIQADTTVESKIFELPDGYSEVVRNGVVRYTEVTFYEK